MSEPTICLCGLCGRELESETHFGREALCPHCGGYLHCCRSCRFFAGESLRACTEPQAEEVRDREAANFCEFFRLSQAGSSAPHEESAGAKSQFESLFRKGPETGSLLP